MDNSVSSLNAKLRELTGNVVGIEDTNFAIDGVRRHVEVTFDCEHDLVLVFVFPDDGAPFAQVDYGYHKDSVKPRMVFDEVLTPAQVNDLASENESYPFNWEYDDSATHPVAIGVVTLIRDYLSAI